ncbi:hypothetical protein FACS189485_11140 [Spirochaetia bacterium]|nr:hypothetical protein FACS189485_11140 [Spirochaetia bacterium]
MYSGIQPHCVLCSTCDYFRHNPNSTMPFDCASGMMSLDCAARVGNQGYKMQTLPKCKYYKPQRARKNLLGKLVAAFLEKK